jgi:hypothetical protein
VSLTAQGKRLWRDRNGNIVTQKPAVVEVVRTPQSPPWPLHKDSVNIFESFSSFKHHEDSVPTSPSSSRTLSISSASEPCSPGNLPDHLPMMQSPKELPTRLSSPGGQWSSPLISPCAKFDLFSTRATKQAPFADLLDPNILSMSNYSLTTLRDCYTLFDTLRRQVR